LVCYDANGWEFTSRNDRFGHAIDGFTRLTRVQRPTDTIYLADDEYNPAIRPIVTINPATHLGFNDVFSAPHLPYVVSRRGAVSLSMERRISATRHGDGPNLLFFDGHSAWKRAVEITVDDWREQR
jgi:prepilin-type processing-associated H-X9-DG protein